MRLSGNAAVRGALALVIGSVTLAGAATQSALPSFETLYARSLQSQAAITNIRARFVETTTSALLVEPIVSAGTVVAVKPGRVVMDYEGDAPRRVLVTANRLLVHWPKRGQTESINIAEIQARVRRHFLDASPDELRKLFAITVTSDPAMPRTYVVEMKPKRDEIATALSELRIWVDRETTLMARLWLAFPNGDSRDFRLEHLETNVPVDDGLFSVSAPASAR